MLTAVGGSIDPFEMGKIQRMCAKISLVWNTYFVVSFSLNNLIRSQLEKKYCLLVGHNRKKALEKH